MVKYIGIDKQPEWMFELEDQGYYYIYTNNQKIFISKEEPKRCDSGGWWHPEIDTLKCIQTIYIDLLTESQIIEFEKFKEQYESI